MGYALIEETVRPVEYGTYDRHRDQSTVSVICLFTAAALMIVGTAEFLYVFVESLLALQGVYQWYPQFVAQQWFIYDELFTIFTFCGALFGSLAVTLALSGRNLTGTIIAGLLCAISGACVFIISLVAPLGLLWRSILYFFLPLFLLPLVGTLLLYYVKLHRD